MCDDRLFLCFRRFRHFDSFHRFHRFDSFGNCGNCDSFHRFHRDPAPSSCPFSRACAPRIAKSNALHRDI